MLDLFAQLFQLFYFLDAGWVWFTKTYGLYPSHNALQVPTLLGVVASVCAPLPTRMQQLPTLLAQQCAQRDIGSLYVSGKLPTYPSPKPKLTLTSHLVQNVGLEEG